MINIFEVNETNKMIEQENLDVRTITMGISLLDCIDSDLDIMNEKIYNKITTKAKDLVATGDKIAAEFGIKQACFRNADCLNRRCGMPYDRRFCIYSEDTGSCSKNNRRKLYRWVFCSGM